MSAHQPTNQTFDPIPLPGATILSLGAEEAPAPESDAHLHEHLAANTALTMEQILQQLNKRDKANYRLGFERGFAESMCISMVAWVIVSLISKCFGEHEAMVKGVLMGVYIWVFAQ